MLNFSKPQFITFEGGEGSGKSTQSKMLHEYLISKRIKAIHTREIGGTIEAEKIRNILIYSELYAMSELMLVMAARYEHINKVIIPALLDNVWVICDRYIDSTACYQADESGLSMDEIYELHNYLMNKKGNRMVGIIPDVTFFMDITPEIGLQRVANRGAANKFEDKDINFHNKVYENFQHISKLYQDRIIKIDCAELTIEEIHKNLLNRLFVTS
jgi:dTMP kinase